MHNRSEFLDTSGNLNREAVRAYFLRVGKLDGLKKKDLVYVSEDGYWHIAVLRRRIPGDCWIADLTGRVLGCRMITVTCSNFGGKVAT